MPTEGKLEGMVWKCAFSDQATGRKIAGVTKKSHVVRNCSGPAWLVLLHTDYKKIQLLQPVDTIQILEGHFQSFDH
mgnify:CR=1 FL=1